MFVAWHSHTGGSDDGGRFGERTKSIAAANNERLGMRIGEQNKTQSSTENFFTLSCHSATNL